MDWTRQNHSIVTLSMDHAIKIFSTNAHVLAESLPNEQLPFTFSKVWIKIYFILFFELKLFFLRLDANNYL
jgi:hypothetical protein